MTKYQQYFFDYEWNLIPHLQKRELRDIPRWFPARGLPPEGYVWAPYIPLVVTPTLLDDEEK